MVKHNIKVTQDNINKLKSMIEYANSKNDQEQVKKLQADLNKHQLELTRLRRIEWEETHERLDFGDDR
jgi:hypothetical protein